MSGRNRASLTPRIAFGVDGRVANGDAANKEQDRLTAIRLQSDAADKLWRVEYPTLPIPRGYGAWDIKVHGLRAKGYKWSKKEWRKSLPCSKSVEWFDEYLEMNGLNIPT